MWVNLACECQSSRVTDLHSKIISKKIMSFRSCQSEKITIFLRLLSPIVNSILAIYSHITVKLSQFTVQYRAYFVFLQRLFILCTFT